MSLNPKNTKKASITAQLHKKPFNSLKAQTKNYQSKLESLRSKIAEQKKQRSQISTAQQQNSTKTSSFRKTNSSLTNNAVTQKQVMNFLKDEKAEKSKIKQKQQINHDPLRQVLEKLKIPHNTYETLTVKNIWTLEDLLNCKQEQIDGWKDIAVGFRAKLRKFINQAPQQYLESARKQSQSQQTQNKQQIEEIVNRRNNEKMFVPIKDKQVEEMEEVLQYYNSPQKKQQKNEEVNNEFQKDEQDILIQSLNQVFLVNKKRKSIMKKSSEGSSLNSPTKLVSWDKDVKNHDRSAKKVFTQKTKFAKINAYDTTDEIEQEENPYQKVTKQIKTKLLQQQKPIKLMKVQNLNQKSAFCWNCLKKYIVTPQQIKISQPHNFCSQNCQNAYPKAINLEIYSIQKQQLTKEKADYQANTNKIQQVQQQYDQVIDLGVL